jgi:hypothetical protein
MMVVGTHGSEVHAQSGPAVHDSSSMIIMQSRAAVVATVTAVDATDADGVVVITAMSQRSMVVSHAQSPVHSTLSKICQHCAAPDDVTAAGVIIVVVVAPMVAEQNP